jgi:dihydrolipoamide dehydrogenase
MSERYDIAVIGAGPAGYVGAIRAAQLGAKVACVEPRELGGCCLNRGCIPTKTLISTAEVYDHMRHARDWGLACENPTHDWPRIMDRTGRVVKQLVSGVGFLFKKNGVTHVAGRGRLVAKDTIIVQSGNGDAEIKADKVLLAMGAEPIVLNIPGADGGGIVTSDEACWLEEFPPSVVIVGGGAIGLEFGYLLRAFGAEVEIIEMLPRIMATEDPELTDVLAKSLKKMGVSIRLESKVTAIRDENGQKVVSYETPDGGGEARGALVLMAVGRYANTQNCGLDAIGVETERGRIKVNERLETTIEGIYAAGDCLRGVGLAHLASHEAVAAVEFALSKRGHMNYDAVPTCLFTVPEIASVGVSEQLATERGLDITVGRFPYRANGKALGMNAREGFCKVIADAQTKRVMGAGIVGEQATNLIAELALAVENGLTLEQMRHTIHCHPTLPEIVHEAAMDAEGVSIHQ